MNFFTMLSAVEAEKEKQKTAIGKKNTSFSLPAVAVNDAAEDPESTPKKTRKKKEVLPEGDEADNVIQPEEPEEDEEEERD